MAIPIPGRTGSTRSTELNALNEIIRKLIEVRNNISSSISSSATLAEQQSQTTLLTSIETEIQDINTQTAQAVAQNTVYHEDITNPANRTFTNFKKLKFVCSGTISVSDGTRTIIYPKTLGTEIILGSVFEADYICTQTITFNGTGTVLVTIQQ